MQTESKEKSLKIQVVIMNTYVEALAQAKGNISVAAELLGIDRRTVQRNMRLYGLKRENYIKV